jgi:hypothetical protein
VIIISSGSRTEDTPQGKQYEMYSHAQATGKCFEVWGFD